MQPNGYDDPSRDEWAAPTPVPEQRASPAVHVTDDSVEATRFAGYVLVTVVGEFDVYSSPRLRDVLADQPADIGLIVDLTGVTFLDSTVLGILVGALKRARSNGGWLRLVCDNQRILKIFRITGLVGVFEIWPTVEGARSDL